MRFNFTDRGNLGRFLASLGMTVFSEALEGVGGSTAALPPYYPQPPLYLPNSISFRAKRGIPLRLTGQ